MEHLLILWKILQYYFLQFIQKVSGNLFIISTSLCKFKTEQIAADNIFSLFVDGRECLIPCMLGNFSCFCCRLLTFSKLTLSKNYFRNPNRLSKDLDPDRDPRSVSPGLGTLCLQMFSAEDKSCC